MKVGDYVRTKDGIIGKIESKNLIGYNDWIIDTLYHNDDEIINDWTCGIKEYNVIKSSPNIIDLIEVGDYVNGHYVSSLPLFKWNKQAGYCYTGDMLTDKDIKSIVTKEQFESMEYKVGE